MPAQPRTKAPSPLPERLVAALTRAERELTDRLAGVLAFEGRTVQEARTLALLTDGAGHPMTEIAEHAALSPPTLTRLVDRMVADNLVHRKVDARDRRRVLVYATPRGKRLQRQLDQRLEACQDEILAETGATQATQLIRLLTAIETHQAPSAT